MHIDKKKLIKCAPKLSELIRACYPKIIELPRQCPSYTSNTYKLMQSWVAIFKQIFPALFSAIFSELIFMRAGVNQGCIIW